MDAAFKIVRPDERGETSLREDLIKIVTEIIEKNRIVMIEDLLKIARKKTGAQRLAIENVIDRLIQEKVIVPGSRIIRKIILRNDTRKIIYNLIKKFPGVNINTIKTSLNLGSNVAMWHLGVLLKFGCVREIRHKSSVLFALPQIPQDEVVLSVLFRKDLNRKILKALESHALPLSSLESMLGEERRNIEYAIKNLQDFAIIEKTIQSESNTSSSFKINPAIETLYFKWAKTS